jgi:undecaprenyl-diphosphatase
MNAAAPFHAVLGYVSDSDCRISVRVRAWAPPRWFRLWMVGTTRFGDGWGWFLVGVLLLAAGDPARRALAAGCLAAAMANAALVLLKRQVRRPRPCEEAPHPLFHVKPPDAYSFPSGHATNAFTACTTVGLAFPPLAPPLALLAASIAASRVVLGLHYVSDVLTGALIGTAAAIAAHLLLY